MERDDELSLIKMEIAGYIAILEQHGISNPFGGDLAKLDLPDLVRIRNRLKDLARTPTS